MLFQKKFKNYVRQKVEGYTKTYFETHQQVRLIAVVGSVGKTSTKLALAAMLGQHFRLRLHEGNHNTEMSAPLAIMGIKYPDDVRSITQWRRVFRDAILRINAPPDVDIIIQELGADHPGDIMDFGRYLKPEMAIVTAITPEHMEYFVTMDAVAREELSVANFSKTIQINRDDVDGSYANLIGNPNINTYGTSEQAEYRFISESFSLNDGHVGKFYAPELPMPIEATIKVVGEHNIRPAVAAAMVAVKLGMSPQEIAAGFSRIKPIPGRMQLFEGQQNSTIIDDTYNSSPAAAKSAIETFLSLEAPQRIAILGSMSELGIVSEEEHRKIGQMFHPDDVEWVITVGDEAGKYLAPAAHANGCQVKSFKTSVEAGGFAHHYIRPNSLILAKGSQNGIFVEEAVKVILKNPSDNHRLVRQSPAWLAHKEQFFAQFEKLG